MTCCNTQCLHMRLENPRVNDHEMLTVCRSLLLICWRKTDVQKHSEELLQPDALRHMSWHILSVNTSVMLATLSIALWHSGYAYLLQSVLWSTLGGGKTPFSSAFASVSERDMLSFLRLTGHLSAYLMCSRVTLLLQDRLVQHIE